MGGVCTAHVRRSTQGARGLPSPFLSAAPVMALPWWLPSWPCGRDRPRRDMRRTAAQVRRCGGSPRWLPMAIALGDRACRPRRRPGIGAGAPGRRRGNPAVARRRRRRVVDTRADPHRPVDARPRPGTGIVLGPDRASDTAAVRPTMRIAPETYAIRGPPPPSPRRPRRPPCRSTRRLST